MICIPVDEEGGSDENEEGPRPRARAAAADDGDSSSSDDNDSAAAAHAAAIGHSPQPVTLKIPLTGGKDSAEPSSDKRKPQTTPKEEAEGDTAGAPMEVSPSGGEANPDADADENSAMEMSDRNLGQAIKETGLYACPYNINERDTDENTALHVAIHARKLEHVKLLVQMGASVHKKSDGSSPVHTAISIGSIPKHTQFAYDCVVFLAENGADLAAKDEALHTPLYLACMHNLPKIVEFILSSEAGASTLNLRADRTQGRALHVAAKFDFSPPVAGLSTAVAPGHPRIPQLHHPDGTIASSHHHIPGSVAHSEPVPSAGKHGPSSTAPKSMVATTGSEPQVTMILLCTPGIEVDATNSVGQTPLHVACARGNWNAVRLLQQAGASLDLADRRGYTPGQLAHKRGMLIPLDLLEMLGGPPSSGIIAPPRDLIVDPNSSTLLMTHELCILHRTCPPIRRNPHDEPPPENIRRLTVLVDEESGILRTGEFGLCAWENEARRAAMVDVLKVCWSLWPMLYRSGNLGLTNAIFRGSVS